MNQLKQVLGILGLMAALAGIAFEQPVLVWIAIGVLGASMMLRMVVAARDRRNDDP